MQFIPVCEENNVTMFIDAEESRRLDTRIMVLEELLKTYKFADNYYRFGFTGAIKTCFLGY